MTEEQLTELIRTWLGPGLVNVAGILLSLVCSYVPGWREKWAAKDPVLQSLGMLGAITFITILIGVVSFAGWLPIVPATPFGIILLVVAWVTAQVTNETTYRKSPQVASVIVARNARNLLKEAKVEVKQDKAEDVAEARADVVEAKKDLDTAMGK